MTAAPHLRGTGLLLALLAATSCSVLHPEPASRRSPSTFLASQYLERGRAAWAAGNEANARFLIGKSVELDPANKDALALWQSHWPLDSLPLAALSARGAASDSATRTIPSAEQMAEVPTGEAEPSDAVPPPEGTPAPVPSGGAAPSEGAGLSKGVAPSGGATPSARVPPSPSGEASAPEGVASRPPPPPPDPETLARAAAARALFESARVGGDREALKQAGDALLQVQPRYLPDLHRVLSAWVVSRVQPAATEVRVRDLLGSLEFGDSDFLIGKPPDVPDAAYLRAYRGRFLDLLGWSAFLRGDMAQAEAALRSAETEINLRGRGDVSHLRRLATFYERKGNLVRAESYAIAAAARDTSGWGEVQAAAARLWAQRHRGSRAGLEARLAEEATRVRHEEQSAAIAGRLYAPLPALKARRADGVSFTDLSMRGRVTVLVLWTPGCADCRRLLGDLGATTLAAATTGSGARRPAPVEVVALDLSGPSMGDGTSGRGASTLPQGVIGAMPESHAALARALRADDLPVTLIIEPAGFIQYRHTGYPAEPEARQRWLEVLRWQIQSLVSLREEG